MLSSIFNNELTVVDHAYINDYGKIIGGSFLPSFIVSGELDPVEKVVIDFSTVKKNIKNIIDNHYFELEQNGLDHKLWIIEGYSLCEYILNTEGTINTIEINTPCCKLILPLDAVKLIKGCLNYSISEIGKYMENFVETKLSTKYFQKGIKVKCNNSTRPVLPLSNEPYSIFTYTHGLKDSTSYGCVNLAHGHLSYIQIKNGDIQILNEIASYLNGAIIINKANIINKSYNNITIGYTHPDRGEFFGSFQRDNNKLIILETETTIEYIIEYICEKFNLQEFDLYISEGLTKGAYLNSSKFNQ